jgi:hypothetical protein
MFAAVVASIALFAMSLPASAHDAPQAIDGDGTAQVSPGLTFPGVDVARDFDFVLNSSFCVTLPTGDAATLTAEGAGHGWCGALSMSGTGTLAFPDGHGPPSSFIWAR